MQNYADDESGYIPRYLSPSGKNQIREALKDFKQDMKYYLDIDYVEMIQGDFWSGISFYDYHENQLIASNAIVISNSCDITPANKRDYLPNVIFAPVVTLSNLREAFLQDGIDEKKIDEKIEAMRKQHVSQVMFLPRKEGIIPEDCVALLDRIMSIPTDRLDKEKNKRKLTTLSQKGFYLFTMKMAIHLCRRHEDLDRDNLQMA